MNKKNDNKRSSRSNASKMHSKRSKTSSSASSSRRSITSKKSSSKTYYCSGCNETFINIFQSPSQFINNHMKLNKKCESTIIHCDVCQKDFIDENCFMSHITRSNVKCRRFHNQKAASKNVAEGFNSSEVKISSSTSYKSNNIITNLDNHPMSPSFFLTSSVKKLSSNDLTKKRIPPPVKNSNICNPCQEEAQTVTSLKDINNNMPKNDTSEEDDDDEVDPSAKNLVLNTNENKHSHFGIDDDSDIGFDNYDEEYQNQEEEDISKLMASDDIDISKNDKYDEDISSSISSQTNNNINSSSFSTISNTSTYPKQSYLKIDSNNHLLSLLSKQDNELSSLTSDSQYIDSLKLIQTLMRKKISLSCYKDMMKWKYDGDHLKYYSLDQVTKLAENRVYGPTIASKMKPRQNNLICPSGRKVNVITFDIDAAIFDLLSDQHITNPSSMIFDDSNIDDPFAIKPKEYFDDLDQSGIYIKTNEDIIHDRDKELLVPLIVYLDETFLDTFSKLVLHPVVITLGLFNRSTRNLSMSWRSIGYLPNFDESFGSKQYTADQKASDFHFCLRFILNNNNSKILVYKNRPKGFTLANPTAPQRT